MIIGIDIDEVCVDLHTEWLRRYNLDYDDDLTPGDITRWEIDEFVKPECGKKIFSYLKPDIYDDVKPIPGAKEAVEVLRHAGHRVIFVTAGNGERKLRYMREHGFLPDTYPPLDYASLYDKALLKLDVLIDDRPDNLEGVRLPILLDRPHNRHEDRFTRAFGLVDAVRLIGHEELRRVIAQASSDKTAS